MEILISLDAVEPPAGRVRRVADRAFAADDDNDKGVEFVGWLGLLRALDGVIGGTRPPADG